MRSPTRRQLRARALYILLSGDKIGSHPSWRGFKSRALLGHKIVHEGERATPQPAEASVRAATDLIAHVEAVIADARAT
jgi:hypothetical protein